MFLASCSIRIDSMLFQSLCGNGYIVFQLTVVKLAAQAIQLVADISTSPRDPILSTALIVSLYTFSSLLFLITVIWDMHHARRFVARRDVIRARDWGIGTDEAMVAAADRDDATA